MYKDLKGHINKALNQLADKGVSRINVEFTGGGDEGQINGIFYFEESDKFELVDVTKDFQDQTRWNPETRKTEVVTKAKHQLTSVTVAYNRSVWNSETKIYEDKCIEKELTAEHLIENFVYEQLEDTGVDWYNNEGGYGEYHFLYNKEKGTWTFKCEVYQYYLESSLEHRGEGGL